MSDIQKIVEAVNSQISSLQQAFKIIAALEVKIKALEEAVVELKRKSKNAN